MNSQRIGVMDLCERAGISRNAFNEWRTRKIPRADALEACWNVLGYSLRPVKLPDDPDAHGDFLKHRFSPGNSLVRQNDKKFQEYGKLGGRRKSHHQSSDDLE